MKKVLIGLLLSLSCIGIIGCGDVNIKKANTDSGTSVATDKVEDISGYDIVLSRH